MKTRIHTAVIHKEESVYVAEGPEVGRISQGNSMEDVIENLKEATELYLEEFPLSEIKAKPFLNTFEANEDDKVA